MKHAGLDQQLVKQIQQGDKAAFDMLAGRYQQRLSHLISRYLRDSGEVNDATQDTLIKAYQALPNFRGDSAFYTWIYRIAINTAKNYQQQKMRMVNVTETGFTDNDNLLEFLNWSDEESPEHLAACEELKDNIQGTLDGLPMPLAHALALRDFVGLNYEEIADIMNCPVGTVRSRIFRARHMIESRLAKRD